MTAIKVCKFFIKSSPVGELQDVLEDVSSIIGQDFLQNADIKEALREYYEAHKLHLQFPDGTTVLVTSEGRQEPLVRYIQTSNPIYQEQQPYQQQEQQYEEQPYQQPVQEYQQEQVQQPKKGGLFDGEDDYGDEGNNQYQEQQQNYDQQQPVYQEQQPEYQEQQQEQQYYQQEEQVQQHYQPQPYQEQQYEQEKVVEDFVYYDPVRKMKFSFNPLTLEVKTEEDNCDLEAQSLSHSIVALRDEVVTQMNAYLGRQFRKGTTEYAVYATSQSLKIEISCHNLNFKNYWGGEWLSSWEYDLSNDHISGHIKAHNHYFEQGNIQFNMNKDIPSTQLKTKGGKAIVDFISKSETNYQEGLEEMYTEISEKLLKGMRRILPITRTKFDWSRPNLI